MIGRIDTSKDYDPKKHSTLLLAEIIKFNEEYADTFTLLGLDATFAATAGGLGTYLTNYFLGYWAGFATFAVTGLSLYKYLNPAEQLGSFAEEHEKMMKLYDWCCKSASTEDEIFLQLLKTVAPFTMDRERLIPDVLRHRGLSSGFQEILMAAPHSMVFDKSCQLKSDKKAEPVSARAPKIPVLVQNRIADCKFMIFSCRKKQPKNGEMKQNSSQEAGLFDPVYNLATGAAALIRNRFSS